MTTKNDFTKLILTVVTVISKSYSFRQFLRNKINFITNEQWALYTPSNEHFGIVPIEAMSHGLPVIAMNSRAEGNNSNGITGYLCDPTSKSITEVIEKLLEIDDRDEMGEAGGSESRKCFHYQVSGINLILFV